MGIGFALLFLDPEPAIVKKIIDTMLRPFPAGLYTPVGIVVANPCYAFSGLYNKKSITDFWKYDVFIKFNEDAYHGTVIWGWQHAVIAAGIVRQLERDDLTKIKSQLTDAHSQLWSLINFSEEQHASEWWSFKSDGTKFVMKEQLSSNPAQLWNTVPLALQDQTNIDISGEMSPNHDDGL